MLRVAQLHRLSFFNLLLRSLFTLLCKERIAPSAESNGPYVRPRLKSSKLSAIPRSTMGLGVRIILPFRTFASRTSPTSTRTCWRSELGSVTWYFALTLTRDIESLETTAGDGLRGLPFSFCAGAPRSPFSYWNDRTPFGAVPPTVRWLILMVGMPTPTG